MTLKTTLPADPPTCNDPEVTKSFPCVDADPPSGGSASGGERRRREGAQPLTCEQHEIDTRPGFSEGGFSPVNSTDSQVKKASEKNSEKRTERWRVLGLLWDMSTLDRVRKCGRVVVRPGGHVGVRQKNEAVGYAGLLCCGSVWACPRCSARILAVRRLELGVLITAASVQGLTIVFGTVTLRHKKGQRLEQLWAALTKGQQGVANATKVKRLRESLGRIGYVRATEVTYGANGWHPHIHTIQIFKNDVSQKQLDELRNAEYAVWKRQCQRLGLGTPRKERYELRRVVDANVEFSDYFAKGVYDPSVARAAKSVGYEMTSPNTKQGRYEGSRTPWQVLEDFSKSGDLDDWVIFEEYEQASKGKRALVWSNGLKKLFGIGELKDEEITDQEVGDQDDTLFYITDWSYIAANSVLGGKLLAAVQTGGLKSGLEFCRRYGIPTKIGVPS